MTTCREMSELVTDYMEGTLPWRGRIAAWHHLRICSMCRAYYDQLDKLKRLLERGNLPGPEAEAEAAALRPLRTRSE